MAERQHRMQVVLPERSYQRMTKLVELTEAASMAEVIREALRLYEAIVEETEAGAEVEIVRANGDRVKVLA